MIMSIFCKNIEKNDIKFTIYRMLLNKKWYQIRFAKGLPAPQTFTYLGYIFHAFIKINYEYEVKKGKFGEYIYIEKYEFLTENELNEHIERFKKEVQEFTASKKNDKMNFSRPTTGESEEIIFIE